MSASAKIPKSRARARAHPFYGLRAREQPILTSAPKLWNFTIKDHKNTIRYHKKANQDHNRPQKAILLRTRHTQNKFNSCCNIFSQISKHFQFDLEQFLFENTFSFHLEYFCSRFNAKKMKKNNKASFSTFKHVFEVKNWIKMRLLVTRWLI